MLSKKRFVDACVDACNKSTFVTPKHDATNLSSPYNRARSVNCMDNPQMAAYLQNGAFKVHCYADINSNHSPEFYIVTPNDPSVVPGSGIPAMSTTPTTQCDVLAVPSGVVQGWHGYAHESSKVSARVANGGLSPLGELS